MNLDAVTLQSVLLDVREHFLFDLEGAVLFPGDAFYDENEQAVRSVLIQGRTTFVF